MTDIDSGASTRPIDRFVEQFQKRDLRAHFLWENRIRPRDVEEWVYPAEERVQEAEEAIGKSLPPSYKYLVRNFHPGELPFDFYWIGGVGTCWVDGMEVRLLDLVDTRWNITFVSHPFDVGRGLRRGLFRHPWGRRSR